MAPTIQPLTLLVALLLAPGAAALAVDLDPSPTKTGLQDALVQPAPAAGEAAQAAQGAIAQAGQAARDLLACRDAVRVTLTWYGARITDRRERQGEFLVEHGWIESVQHRVPVFETVVETVGRASSPLGGLLEPVTRTVQRQVGFEVVAEAVPHSVDLAVAARWSEEYLTWSTYQEGVFVTLPAGSLAMLDGTGVATRVCDSSVPVRGFIPDPDTSEVDYVCADCTGQPADGWAVRIGSLDVRLATAQDYGRLDWAGKGSILCPLDVMQAAEGKAKGMGLSSLDGAWQAWEREAADRSDVASGPDVLATPQGASTLEATPSMAVLAAVVAAVVGLLGLAAVAAWRRR